MKTHYMHLNPEPFSKIENETKKYELRLLDEKRKDISVGDVISFECFDGRKLDATVVSLTIASNFSELISKLCPENCGFEEGITSQQAADLMEKYYSADEQKKYHVLGIGLEICEDLKEKLTIYDPKPVLKESPTHCDLEEFK